MNLVNVDLLVFVGVGFSWFEIAVRLLKIFSVGNRVHNYLPSHISELMECELRKGVEESRIGR